MTPRPQTPPQGMTLVELMVGLTLGLFLVAVMSSIFLGSKATFVAQEATARLQENARFVIDTLSQDLRMSGFRGCQAGSELTNTLNTPTDWRYRYDEPVWGSRHAGAWLPALPTTIASLGPTADGDVLVVRRPIGSAWALVTSMADPTDALVVTPTAQLDRGDLLMLADCAGAALLQATNAAPGTSGQVQHQSSATGLTPGVAQDSLGRAFTNDAQLWRMQVIAYYLADSRRRPGERALWAHRHPSYGAPADVELVTGIEALAVTYGLDTDGDQAADRVATADQVADWRQVVTARLELLLVAAADAPNVQPQPYTFNGTTFTPTDRRQRSVVSALVSLRNALP